MVEEKSLDMSVHNVSDGPAADHSDGEREVAATGPSQLDRYISLKPLVAFGLTLQGSWESIAISFQSSMLNGGPVTLSYGIIITALGSSAIALSLGEMASIDPTVGAQYRWTARHCPRGFNPKFWGLLQGWLTWFAWIAACALTPFVMGTTLQAMIIFNYPDYIFERWHTTLLIFACILLPALVNIYARRVLASLEIIGGVCHFLFFIANVVTLAVLAQRSTNTFVWATLINNTSGWTNSGAAFCIGLLSPTFVLSGFDGVLHMSDEAKNAPKRVPWSMFLSVAINAVFAFAFIICLLYCLGDFDTVVGSATGLPIIEVYYQATKSKAATNFFVAILFVMYAIGNFNILASVSRLTWAFARDRGLPFSSVFSYIHPGLKIPLNSLILVAVLSALLALINLGSTTAFSAILSLSTLALYISYLPPMVFFLIKKLQGRKINYGPFRLGRWGVPINIFGLAWGIFIIAWLPFPVVLPVTKDTMNYAGPVWVACFLIAIGDWYISGHKRFQLPIEDDTIWQREEDHKEHVAVNGEEKFD